MESALSSKEITLFRNARSVRNSQRKVEHGASTRCADDSAHYSTFRSRGFGPADYATGDPTACVASGLRLQIVRFRVNNDRAADRRFRIVREGNLMIDV